VTNAAEAIGDEPGTIVLRTGQALLDPARRAALGLELAPGVYAVLTVADSGSGIDPALRQRIFEPFFSTKFTGRGLGLSAVHGIVRSHGGALHVESDVGAGAAFTIFLPTTSQAQLAPPPAAPGQAPPPGAVLVVDDERAVLTIAARMLSQLGMQTITAESGAEALAALHTRAGEIAAVLVDLTMPQMSGAELFGAIQRTYPSIPVVLMSGYTAEEATSHFGPQTPAYFLQKPFTLAALRAAFTEVLAAPGALPPQAGG
jgi:CheY-like chemotaxis protein